MVARARGQKANASAGGDVRNNKTCDCTITSVLSLWVLQTSLVLAARTQCIPPRGEPCVLVSQPTRITNQLNGSEGQTRPLRVEPGAHSGRKLHVLILVGSCM